MTVEEALAVCLKYKRTGCSFPINKLLSSSNSDHLLKLQLSLMMLILVVWFQLQWILQTINITPFICLRENVNRHCQIYDDCCTCTIISPSVQLLKPKIHIITWRVG